MRIKTKWGEKKGETRSRFLKKKIIRSFSEKTEGTLISVTDRAA